MINQNSGENRSEGVDFQEYIVVLLKRGDVAKLDVITCGSYPANPAELLLG